MNQPPIDNDHVAPGCQPFSEETIALNKQAPPGGVPETPIPFRQLTAAWIGAVMDIDPVVGAEAAEAVNRIITRLKERVPENKDERDEKYTKLYEAAIIAGVPEALLARRARESR